MPLNGLGQFTPEEFEEATKDKKPLKIRICLFFDGTLNNRFNIEEREKREIAAERQTELGIETKVEDDDYDEFTKKGPTSFDNGRTNIAIMEPQVITKKSANKDYDFVYKHYISGQGTIQYQKDVKEGYAIATGETGVPHRAEQGITFAVNSIFTATEIDPVNNYIEKLTIDVFGFSRGAATARYAIHVIREGSISFVDEYGNVYYEWDPVVNRLNTFNYVMKEEAVEIGFAGLYDTVLSYIGSQILPWTANTLQQKAIKHAKKSVHLAAADEHRYDFPLHKIQSAVKAGKGEEYYLPGVHSDIGGSYNQANNILVDNGTEEEQKVVMSTSNEGSDDPIERSFWLGSITSNTMVINKSTSKRIQQDRQDLINQGWYLENEIKEVVIRKRRSMKGGGSRADRSILTVSRQNIHSSYSNIPLKIMARFARDPEVKLKIRGKLERNADRILEPENDLKDLAKKIDAYIASHKNNSKPEDWTGEEALKEYPELKKIRNKHFHFSASSMGIGFSPNIKWDKDKKKYVRKRYYYNA